MEKLDIENFNNAIKAKKYNIVDELPKRLSNISGLIPSECLQDLFLMLDYFNIPKNFNEKIGD